MPHIRISATQERLLFGSRDGKVQTGAATAPRARKRKDALPENILEKQIADFLRVRGWYLQRLHVGTYVPLGRLMDSLNRSGSVSKDVVMRNIVRIGEKGLADALAMRPSPHFPGSCQMFFWEAKAPGKRPSPEQRLFLDRARATGFMAAWFDGFEGSFDTDFCFWYRENFG